MTDSTLKELIKLYKPNASVIELVKNTPFLLLVGISGAGKDTIKKKLLASGKYYDFISHTTRPPRVNDGVIEQDGSPYYFISHDQAKAMLQNGEYIEANEYSANIYGTSYKELQKAHATGKIVINDVEVQGVAEYKDMASGVNAVFILPPSYEEWHRRRMKRYENTTVDEDDMKRRLATAIHELEFALSSGHFVFVVNDDLDKAVNDIDAIAHGKVDSVRRDEAITTAKRLLRQLSTH